MVYSNIMTSQFNRFIPYEERLEYNPTPQARATECSLLADMADVIMEVPSSIGTPQACDASIDKTHTFIYRAFRYLDGDNMNGWLWPLVEKELIVSYERHLDENPIESYHIETNLYIHQKDIEVHTISTEYDIVYSDLARTAVAATIRSINLVEANEEEYVTRPLTTYDSERLCDEFSAFDHLLHSGKHEDIRAAQQGGY